MRVIALVLSIVVLVHFSTASQVTKQSTLEMILANSVPLTELVFCVVPAWRTLAWQLDLLGVLNVPIVITCHSYLPLLLVVSSLCSLSFHSTSLLLRDSLMESSSMLTLHVWAYKIIFFPSEIRENPWLVFLHCKLLLPGSTWTLELRLASLLDWMLIRRHGTLQFLFPFYIWGIAGIIIVACRYSSCFTNLIGSRAVPLLATLFFLSYMKLLRTI